jgi:hypothetical protein
VSFVFPSRFFLDLDNPKIREKKRHDEVKALNAIKRIVDGGWRKTNQSHDRLHQFSEDEDDRLLDRRKRPLLDGKI